MFNVSIIKIRGPFLRIINNIYANIYQDQRYMHSIYVFKKWVKAKTISHL